MRPSEEAGTSFHPRLMGRQSQGHPLGLTGRHSRNAGLFCPARVTLRQPQSLEPGAFTQLPSPSRGGPSGSARAGWAGLSGGLPTGPRGETLLLAGHAWGRTRLCHLTCHTQAGDT